MPLKKIALVIVSWAILAVVACAFFRLARHPRLSRMRGTLKEKSETLGTNVFGEFSEEITRRPPISTIELEENLKVGLPVPFAKFSRTDWEEFWQVLYGKYEMDSGQWPRRKRQLSRQEVQTMLGIQYQQPFNSFTEEQWAIFWQRILKGKVF
ncbi:MAG: hypothetical protein JSV30_05520 [Candidatus Omnitrophota bacterium]|nr:MAG: hypothetical protein JSV30_05520 [Candidatus Omnitrophota bacterium]